MLSSINKEQRLYVLKCGGGVTCSGFDYLDAKARKIQIWLMQQGQYNGDMIPARKGTKKHFNICNDIINLAGEYCRTAKVKCDAMLSPQLRGLEGRRVEVVDNFGEKRRFNVGKSTGWLVIHLEIPRRNSSGGMSADNRYKSVNVVA